MNRENVLKLADVVERSETFDMIVYWQVRPHDARRCGTPACIAGHAAALFFEEHGRYVQRHPDGGIYASHTEQTAALFLGINGDRGQQIELFCPRYEDASCDAFPSEPGWISADRAAAVLRHFAETGEIDWSVGK